MAQYIKQGNIFGRIGTGLGKGIGEQVPKEVEHQRLRSGLRNLADQSGKLSPSQFLAEAAGTYGATPQIIQSFGELSKQQARGQALSQMQDKQPQSSPFPVNQNRNQESNSKIPSITKEKTLEKVQEGYIPPTIEERDSIAGDAFNSNPAFFNNDPQKAIDWADQKIAQEEKINLAYQKQHGDLTKLQDNVIERLQQHYNKLGAKVPSDVYSKIEDKAIEATKPKSEGGKGLTEHQAMKEYGKELDDISRNYQEIDSVGNWGITGKSAKKSLSALQSLQSKFEKNDDTRNFADQMVARNKISNPLAYSIAQPISSEPQLAIFLKKFPNKQKESLSKGYYQKQNAPIPKNILEKTASLLGKKGSPLAVGYELEKKGYDVDQWYEYLNKNRDKLLKFQSDQLDKPRNEYGTLNDWWLSEWTGLGD